MSRKAILSMLMAVMFIFGSACVAYIFVISLQPNAKAKSQYYADSVIDISDLVPSKEKIVISLGMPILVKQVTEREYVVMVLYARFSRKNIVGCILKPVSESSINYPDYPKGTAYTESCRGVWYDKDGNVLPKSHPAALPLVRLKWEYVPNDRKKIRIYT